MANDVSNNKGRDRILPTGKIDIRRISISRGIIFGGMSVVTSMVMRTLNFDLQYPWLENMIHVLLLLVFIVAATQWCRYIEGKINIKTILTISIGIALIASIINALYQIVYLNFFDLQYLESYQQNKHNFLVEKYNLGNDEVNAILESIWTKMFMSIPLIILRITVVKIVFAIGFSYVSSFADSIFNSVSKRANG